MAAFDFLFEPRRVAVVGVDPDPKSQGFTILKNALYGGLYVEEPDGFLGEIYAVGDYDGSVLGSKLIRSIDQLPEGLDLAVLCGPVDQAPDQLEQLAAQKVPCAVILEPGNAEICAKLGQLAKDKGIRILGPGTHGLIANTRHLNASNCPMRPYPGRIAMLADHGSILNSYLQHSHDENVGFSLYLSAGQACDIKETELLHMLADNVMTNCVALAFSRVEDGEALLAAARAVLEKKPLVYLRSNRMENAALDAQLQELGAFATTNLAEFVDAARALSAMPPATKNAIHVVTNGGPMALVTDTARELGLQLTEVTDLGPMADREAFQGVLQKIGSDESNGGVCVILSLQPGSPPLPIAEVVADWAEECELPITASCVGLAGQACEDHLDIRGIPEYEFPFRALFGMKALVHRGTRG